MVVKNYAMGRLNPVIYFENARGEISLPPSTDDALRIRESYQRRGWHLREAGTLSEIDELQKRLQKIEYDKNQEALERDETNLGAIRKSIRARLYARMVSSSTPEYEKEFIRQYLMLRDDRRAQWQNRFTADVCYLNMREFDSTHHLQEIVDNVPEMKDDACKRCGRYRRAYNTDYCVGCLPVMTRNGYE